MILTLSCQKHITTPYAICLYLILQAVCSSPIPIPAAVASAIDSPIQERGRLSRLQLDDGPSTTQQGIRAVDHHQPRGPMRRADSAWSTGSGSGLTSRSRSRSRSRSPLESVGEAGDSSIMSPAAEFLGSFSSAGSKIRNPSASSATPQAGFHRQPPQARQPSSDTWNKSFIAPDPDEDGEEVDGYILEKTLGQGTFSVVKSARNKETGEQVAVKIVRHAQYQQPRNQTGMTASTYSNGDGQNKPSDRRPSILGVVRPKRPQRARSCSSPSPFVDNPAAGFKQAQLDGLPAGSAGGLGVMVEEDGLPASSAPADGLPGADDMEEDDVVGDLEMSMADEALQKEVAIWSNLDAHPHIVPLLHYHESDFASFIFMPLCEENLLKYVRDHGRGGSKSPELAPVALPSSPPRKYTLNQTGSRSPPNSTMSPSSASGLSRASSISSHAGPVQAKVHRSSSIRLRHPGEIVSGGAGLPLPKVKRIFSQIVSGVEYLHLEARVTHKDIKLENILLDRDGETFKVSDFGLAHAALGADSRPASATWHARLDPKKRREHALSDGVAQEIIASATGVTSPVLPSLGSAASTMLASTMAAPDNQKSAASNTPFPPKPPSLTKRRSGHQAVPASLSQLATAFGDAAGSLQYTSPEQIRSPAPVTDASVDIWALGCVLYAMIEGRLPFDDGFEPRLRVNIMKGDWKLPAALESKTDDDEVAGSEKQQIEAVLRGCLEVDPQKRWTIQQIADSEWLRDAMNQLRPPLSPTRGRKREGPLMLVDEESRRVRSRSRGRPAILRRDSSQHRSSSGSSGKRGPSVDEYRRARGDSGQSPSRSGRSRSNNRRYNGESLNTWELL